jgi:hypothetical protein
VEQNAHSTAPLAQAPTLAEDLLLLLFQPKSGTIAGENTLFYVLGAAVFAELAHRDSVTVTRTRKGGVTVAAAPGRPPSDELFASTWGYVSEKPRSIQAVLAVIGPRLRKPLLERLVVRGDIREVKRKRLGVFTTTRFLDGGTGRRAALLRDVRAPLLGDVRPTERVAALAALLYGSGALPQFDPEIPWSSSVVAHAQELTRADVGATAANEAVTRTVTAIIINSVISSSVLSATMNPPR